MTVIPDQITGREKKVASHQMLVSKTDAKGVIMFANDNFVDVSGYSMEELVGQPHSILRHPDMPRAIFYHMWDSIKHGNNIMAVVKNKTKRGDHYWVTTDFEIRRDREGRIQSYIAFRHAAPRHVVREIEPLYASMLEIEKKYGMDASFAYLEGYLETIGMSYDAYIQRLAAPKGLAATVFTKMKEILNYE